ncbi:hypothetical protein JL722_10739 [Aureococcus anophagefferens]|nr:hypothetical protein JL722_10739 [Aureococcus anophagefferens]
MAPRSLSLPARSSAERQAELWSQSGQASSSTQLDDHAGALAPPRAGDTAAASALLTATLAAPDAGGDLWAPLEAALALRPDGWAVADLGAKTERTYAETAARARRRLAHYAVAGWAGLVALNLNPRLSGDELAYCLSGAACAALVVDARHEALVDAARAERPLDVRAALWAGADGAPATFALGRYEAAASGAAAARAAFLDDGAAGAEMYYTSGTSGRPKGVVLSRRNVLLHALGCAVEHRLRRGDVWLHAAPMFHLVDAYAIFAVTWVGGRHVAIPGFSGSGVADAVAERKVTASNLASTMVTLLLADATVKAADWSSLELLSCGGAPLSRATVLDALNTFKCEFFLSYGMTECCGKISTSLVDGPTRDRVGPAATLDLDMILVGSENVYCVEVERAPRPPGVVLASVFGVPDGALGERVFAVVVRADDAVAAADLRRHCARKLADFKVPAVVECGRGRNLELVVATRGAADDAALDGVPAAKPSQALAGSAVWGLVRSAAEELEAPARLADLCPCEADATPTRRHCSRSSGRAAGRGGLPAAAAPRAGARRARRAARGARRRAGVHVVTGGAGGLGAAWAEFLARAGGDAATLVLASRRPPAPALEKRLDDLAAATGARASSSAGVSSKRTRPRLDRAAGLRADGEPLHVWHLAGVVGDAAAGDVAWGDFDDVLRAKVDGSMRLHDASLAHDVATFVLFSSVYGLLGAPRLPHYAAANAFQDGLAAARARAGLPALAVSWGTWADAGMAHRFGGGFRAARERAGFGFVPLQAGLAVLADLAGSRRRTECHAAVVPADWRAYAASRAEAQPSPASSAPGRRAAARAVAPEARADLVVAGAACRFPGRADLPEELWALFVAEADCVLAEPPADRPHTGLPGAYLAGDTLRNFDRAAFGVSAAEAAATDPQQRLFLECAAEALEVAGLPCTPAAPGGVRGRDASVGVFAAIETSDYAFLHQRAVDEGRAEADAYCGTGWHGCVAPNRVSYVFDLRGPSVALNSACSSSLTCVAVARNSVERRECGAALVGGANLQLQPHWSGAFAAAGMLSPSFRCRFGDDAADGYDGRSNGLTAPNPAAQAGVLDACYGDFSGDGAAARGGVALIEAHGTGTRLGDPVELGALGSAKLGGDATLRCGSAKTNVGHLEGVSGLAGLLKAALVVASTDNIAPRSLHFCRPNAHVPWDALRVRVLQLPDAFSGDAAATVGVSSFGFGGALGHVAVGRTRVPAREAPAEGPVLVPFAAHSLEALKKTAAPRRASRRHASRRASVGPLRARPYRAAAALDARDDDAKEALAAAAAACRGPASAPPRLALAFTGQGAAYAGMGRALYGADAAFAAAFDAALDAVGRHGGDVASLRGAVVGAADDAAFATSQPALFCFEYALARCLLARLGREAPDAVVGHSLGEVAAFASRASSRSTARRLVVGGAAMGALAPGVGAMAAVRAGVDRVREVLGDDAPVACDNSPLGCSLGGAAAAVDAAVARLDAAGVASTRLRVATGFHSACLPPTAFAGQPCWFEATRAPAAPPPPAVTSSDDDDEENARGPVPASYATAWAPADPAFPRATHVLVLRGDDDGGRALAAALRDAGARSVSELPLSAAAAAQSWTSSSSRAASGRRRRPCEARANVGARRRRRGDAARRARGRRARDGRGGGRGRGRAPRTAPRARASSRRRCASPSWRRGRGRRGASSWRRRRRASATTRPPARRAARSGCCGPRGGRARGGADGAAGRRGHGGRALSRVAAEVLAERRDDDVRVDDGGAVLARRVVRVDDGDHDEPSAVACARLVRGGAVAISGGTGAVGLALAAHFVRRGATRVVLLSRSGAVRSADEPLREALLAAAEEKRATVDVVALDVCDGGAVARRRALRPRAPGPGPRRGRRRRRRAAVAHAGHAAARAGPQARRGAAPRDGRRRRARAQGCPPLALEVYLSSITALLGNAGQSDYGAASAALDALAASRRRKHARRARVRAVGPWAGFGMAAKARDGGGGTPRAPFVPLESGDACALLDDALRRSASARGPAPTPPPPSRSPRTTWRRPAARRRSWTASRRA